MLITNNKTTNVLIEYLNQRFFIPNIAPQTVEALRKKEGLEIVDEKADIDDSKTITCDVSEFMSFLN